MQTLSIKIVGSFPGLLPISPKPDLKHTYPTIIKGLIYDSFQKLKNSILPPNTPWTAVQGTAPPLAAGDDVEIADVP